MRSLVIPTSKLWVLKAPGVNCGDTVAFQKFGLQVQSLVGWLKTLRPEGDTELNFGSHRSKLLSDQPAEFHRHMLRNLVTAPTLHDISN